MPRMIQWGTECRCNPDTESFIESAREKNKAMVLKFLAGDDKSASDDTMTESDARDAICDSLIPESRCIVSSPSFEDNKFGRTRFLRGETDFGCTTHGYVVNGNCALVEAYVVQKGKKARWIDINDIQVVKGCSRVAMVPGHMFTLSVTKHISPEMRRVDGLSCRFTGGYSCTRSGVNATFVGWHSYNTAIFRVDAKVVLLDNFYAGEILSTLVQNKDIEEGVSTSRTTAVSNPSSLVGLSILVKSRGYWFDASVSAYDATARKHTVLYRNGETVEHDLLSEDADDFVILPKPDEPSLDDTSSIPRLTWNPTSGVPNIYHLNRCRHCRVCSKPHGALYANFITLCVWDVAMCNFERSQFVAICLQVL